MKSVSVNIVPRHSAISTSRHRVEMHDCRLKTTPGQLMLKTRIINCIQDIYNTLILSQANKVCQVIRLDRKTFETIFNNFFSSVDIHSFIQIFLWRPFKIATQKLSKLQCGQKGRFSNENITG